MKITKTTSFKPYTIWVESPVDHGKLMSAVACLLKNTTKETVGESEVQSLFDELRNTQT